MGVPKKRRSCRVVRLVRKRDMWPKSGVYKCSMCGCINSKHISCRCICDVYAYNIDAEYMPIINIESRADKYGKRIMQVVRKFNSTYEIKFTFKKPEVFNRGYLMNKTHQLVNLVTKINNFKILI